MTQCVVCGRTIRTGWKYCWEHRNTAQAEGQINTTVLDDAEKGFIKYKIKKSKIQLIPLVICLIGLLILCFIVPFNVSFLYMGIFLFIFGLLSQIITKPIAKKIAINMIVDRHPEYVTWVKTWVKYKKDEKEFKKSLFRWGGLNGTSKRSD